MGTLAPYLSKPCGRWWVSWTTWDHEADQSWCPEAGARPLGRWDSNPAPRCFALRGRSGGCRVTCDSRSPGVTARARPGPAVPDAMRTQRGPLGFGPPATDRPDYLLAKPDRAGSSPWETVIGAGRGRCGVVRGCPLGTDHDRCEWHGSGTAEDNPWYACRCWVHLDHRVRAVRGNHGCMGKPLQTARQLFPMPSGRGRMGRWLRRPASMPAELGSSRPGAR